MDREKVIKGWECHMEADTLKCADCPYREGWRTCNYADTLYKDVYDLLKEQEAKQYNNHEVACIIADLFGDPCACNFNNIDEWLPYKCDFRETCCPNPVGVACWEQYLKHKEGR